MIAPDWPRHRMKRVFFNLMVPDSFDLIGAELIPRRGRSNLTGENHLFRLTPYGSQDEPTNRDDAHAEHFVIPVKYGPGAIIGPSRPRFGHQAA